MDRADFSSSYEHCDNSSKGKTTHRCFSVLLYFNNTSNIAAEKPVQMKFVSSCVSPNIQFIAGGCVNQANIPSQQTTGPLWWRKWTEQIVHRRSPPLCCWAAYMAVLQPRLCRSQLGIWEQPYRTGPLWHRENRREWRALTSPQTQLTDNTETTFSILKKISTQ